MATTGSQPVLRWFKRNFVQQDICSPNSSSSASTNSRSVNDAQTTPSTTAIDGLLSVDTESSVDETNNSPSFCAVQYQPHTLAFDKFSSNRSPPFQGGGEGGGGYDEEGRKLRERQFGTRNTLKRLNRYKLRPSLFTDYCSKPEDLNNRGRERPMGVYSSGFKLHQQQRIDSKRVRIGLFYTWSFSGQRPPKFVPIGEGQLGQNPHLDRLWEEAAKTLLQNKNDTTTTTTTTKSTDAENVNSKECCNRVYESPKSLDEYCKTPMGQQMWTDGGATTTTNSGAKNSNSRETAPGDKGHSFAERYPAMVEPRSFYRNVYPYTTLHRFNGYFPKSYGSRPMAHPQPPPPPPPYICGQYNSCTLPFSKEKVNRSNNTSYHNIEKTNVENLHKTFYSSMTGNGGGYYGNPPANVGPVLIAPVGVGRQHRRMNVPKFSSRALSSSDSRRLCNGRNCIFAMILSVTAAIILALAIALFVQINRDNNEFKNLHEQLASSNHFASDLPNSGFASVVSQNKPLEYE